MMWSKIFKPFKLPKLSSDAKMCAGLASFLLASCGIYKTLSDKRDNVNNLIMLEENREYDRRCERKREILCKRFELLELEKKNRDQSFEYRTTTETPCWYCGK